MKRKQNALFLTHGALIAALYVVLTLVASMMGLSSGVIQLRFSEALCVLPIFLPEAVPGLYVGCIISNLLSGGNVCDVIFGSLATLIGAAAAYLLRRLPEKLMWVTTLPTVIANALIVPAVLILAYGVPDSFVFLMVTVGIGEIISAGAGGYALYYIIKRTNIPWLK